MLWLPYWANSQFGDFTKGGTTRHKQGKEGGVVPGHSVFCVFEDVLSRV